MGAQRYRSHRRTGQGSGNEMEGMAEISGSTMMPCRQAIGAKKGEDGDKLGTRCGHKSHTLMIGASGKLNRLKGLSI